MITNQHLSCLVRTDLCLTFEKPENRAQIDEVSITATGRVSSKLGSYSPEGWR